MKKLFIGLVAFIALVVMPSQCFGAIGWSKSWSSADDGSTFGGSNLEDIQDDIDSQVPTLTGDNTFSGTNAFTGTITGINIVRTLILKVIADADVLTTGDGQAYITVPSEYNGMHMTAVSAHVYVASTSGTPTVQIAKASIADYTTFVDTLTTRITIDENEYDSAGATTPAVINTTYYLVATSDILRMDVDVAGTATTGLEVCIQFSK